MASDKNRRQDGLSSNTKKFLILQRRAVSPVVATMVLIVVVVAAVTSFALLFSGFQSQAEKQNNNLTNILNEDLQIAYLQMLPLTWNGTEITSMNITIHNLNTQPSGLVGIEINGVFADFASFANVLLSPLLVLQNDLFVQTNLTQVIPSRGTLQLEVNLSSGQIFQPIPRTSPVSITLITESQGIFSFSIQPPVAEFFARQIGMGYDLLNASSSFSPDTFVQTYSWTIFGQIPGGGILANPPLSGKSVQYFPNTPSTTVVLTVVDGYGLVSRINETLTSALESSVTTTITSTTTISTTETFGNSLSCSGTPTQDMTEFVCPYLNHLEKIREVLMTPYTPGQRQSYGYYSPIGLTCGGNIEPSPAIGVSGGYNNVCVVVDNNFEGGYGLDYYNNPGSVLASDSTLTQWNTASGYSSANFLSFNQNPYFSSIYSGGALNTNIYSTARSYLSTAQPWYGIGGCSAPFRPIFYPTSFSLLDRREGEYGFIGPYWQTLDQMGVHLGGIGNSCGTQGQVWYVENAGVVQGNPLIVTEMPGGALSGSGGLEELSFFIDEAYMQWVAGNAPASTWQNAYTNAMCQYPFPAPRQALHFIQVTRATAAWNNPAFASGVSCGGTQTISATQMLTNAIQQLFTPSGQTGPMGVGGASGIDGGLYQQWGGAGSSDTPEPNMQAVIAFDPDMPNWFTMACFQTQTC